MGATYGNVVVSASPEQVIEALGDVPAYVGPRVGRWIGVFPAEETEASVAAELSASTHGVALWTFVDDAVLFYQLFAFGQALDTYCSDVDVAAAHGVEGEIGSGDAEKLIDATTSDALPGEVRAVLSDGHLRATERHDALVRVLGLPRYVVATGYGVIEQQDSQGDLVRTGPVT